MPKSIIIPHWSFGVNLALHKVISHLTRNPQVKKIKQKYSNNKQITEGRRQRNETVIYQSQGSWTAKEWMIVIVILISYSYKRQYYGSMCWYYLA